MKDGWRWKERLKPSEWPHDKNWTFMLCLCRECGWSPPELPLRGCWCISCGTQRLQEAERARERWVRMSTDLGGEG